MKYFFGSLVIFISAFMFSRFALAAGDGSGKDRGVQLDLGGLYEQYTNNNTGTANTKTTTTNTNGLAGLGYGFGHIYVGGTYFYNVNDAQTTGVGAGETKATSNWLAPTVGYMVSNFRLDAGYIVTASDSVVSGANTTNYSSGTGWFAKASYDFYVSPTVYIAPVLAYYDVSFTSSTLNGVNVANTKFETSNFQPVLTIGFDF